LETEEIYAESAAINTKYGQKILIGEVSISKLTGNAFENTYLFRFF